MPKCPRGCSPAFVKLVFISPPVIGSERVRMATKLVREMADAQGLSDIDSSVSRPGVSVADRNFKKSGNRVQAFAGGDLAKFLATAPRDNVLNRAGFGHPYNPHEWKDGKHMGSSATPERLPTEVVRVRE
jgi:hypothetical protein